METYDPPKQAEESPVGVVRRWLLELKQAASAAINVSYYGV